jgi:hypothetical protein
MINCKDCGKKLANYKAKRCPECYHKSQIGQKRAKIAYCKVCNKQLSRNYYTYCLTCWYNYQRKHPIQKGLKRTLKTRKLISQTRIKNKSAKGKNNPMFGKITHGKWGIYKSIKMRSSYEIAFAKWCKKWNVSYKYEPKVFDLGNTTYTPDFYLPETNEYIEIKGYWRPEAKKKFKIFLKKYNEIRILVLEKEDLQKIGVKI